MSSRPTQIEHFLSTLSRCSTLAHVKQLQAHLLAFGHGQSQLFSFKLARFCATVLVDLRHARLIFDSLLEPNIFLYNALITAFSSRRDPLPAIRLFHQMLSRGCPQPNEFIYPQVLRSCSDLGSLRSVEMVDTHIFKTGFRDYGVVKTSLVDAYSRCGRMDTARTLFDELSQRNVVSWTAMIAAYARVGMVGNAICLFEEMPERDVPAWNAVIAGCTQNGFFGEAAEFFRRMVLAGARPNPTTVVCMLSACGHLGVLQIGKSVHGYIFKNHVDSCRFVSNALVDMYGKCGNLKEARWVFDNLLDRSLTAWNSMINCFALHGKSDDAITLFKEMEVVGLKPDEVTFVGVLNACTHGGLVEEGSRYFQSIMEHGIARRIEHYGCVIDLLGRAGRFDEVTNIISEMKMEPDEVVWGSLWNGCRIHRNAELAEFAARKLLEMEPNSVDYGVMLANLYNEHGKWEEGGKVRKFFKDGGRDKIPGCSWIELDNRVVQFYSTDKTHPQSEAICAVLEGLAWVLGSEETICDSLYFPTEFVCNT